MNSNKDDPASDIDSLLFDERLDQDPFFNEAEPFEAQHVVALRDKLVHLSRFGNLLTLVIGDRGSGKTYLLEELLEQVKEESDICFIQAQPLFTVSQLFQQLQTELLSTTPSAIDNEQFQQDLNQLDISIANRLLVIDDADTLSLDVISQLCALSAAEQSKDSPFLKILLFANHDLTLSIETAASGILPESGIYTIDIPGLSPDDAYRWVEYVLLNEGYRAGSDEIAEIVELGGDNIARLKTLAIDFIDTLPEEEIPDEVFEEKQGVSAMGYWFSGLTILVLLTLAGFFYQQQITELFFPAEPQVTITDEVIDVSEPVVEAKPNAGVSDVIDETEAHNQPASPDDNANEEQQNEISESAEIPIDNELETDITDAELIAMDSNETLPPSDEVVTDDSDISEQLTVTQAQQIVQTSATDVSQSEAVAETEEVENITQSPQSTAQQQDISQAPQYSDSEQQLLAASDDSYVIQIVGLTNNNSVSRLINEYDNLNLLTYRSQLNGKPWTIVVMGIYDNYSEANTQRKNLPEALAINKPWIKSIAKVKNEIRAAVTATN